MAPSIRPPESGLTDGSVELRPVSEADTTAFVEAFQDPAIAEGAYHGQLDGTDDALRPYLGRNKDRMASGDAILLGVWESGEFRGQTMLFNIDWDHLTAELGFWVAKSSRGAGLSQRALRLTLAFAFDHLGIERVFGLTGTDNDAARRVMTSVGLRYEGVLRGLERTASDRLDQACFGMLASDSRP